jgi:LPXTG-motif cell wall-anchored protein
MVIGLLVNWLCVEAQYCQTGDISNVFSTILGTVVGLVIGGGISWWIYNRQQKTVNKQDKTLKHVEELGIKQEYILKKIKIFEEKHDKMLNNILTFDKKIDSLLETK